MMTSNSGSSKTWIYIAIGFIFGSTLGFYIGTHRGATNVKPVQLQPKEMAITAVPEAEKSQHSDKSENPETVVPTSSEKSTPAKTNNFFKNSSATKASEQFFADKKMGEKKLPIIKKVEPRENPEITPVPEQPKLKYERDTALFKDENKNLTIDEHGQVHVRWYPVKGAVKYKLRVFDTYGKLFQEFETPLTYKFLHNLVSNNKGPSDKTKFSYTMTVAPIDANGDEGAPSPTRSIY